VQAPARSRYVLNEDYAAGQATSLRAGLRSAHPESAAAVILLGDQPGVREGAVRAVVQAWLEGVGPVVQASYGGRGGHPTLVGRSIWPALASATGDEGARGLLGEHPEWRRLVEVGGDPPEDIDTQEDYERLRASFFSP
jgi:CTP:molybdopterin cytidylyltransferase MocA